MEKCEKCGRFNSREKCVILYYDEKEMPVCQSCDEKILSQIRQFTREHKGATEEDIRKATHIPRKIINAYIKSGSLELIASSNICNGKDCSEIVEPGQQYCKKCLRKINIAKQLMSSYENTSLESLTYKESGSGFHSSLGRRR